MIKDVVAAGGAGLLIPAVLFALLLYATRGLFGLHGRRSQHRREFLDIWDPKRADDDIWLEVTVRHLCGTSLPAHVIRTALKHPHSTQALNELSELWQFFDYDPETRHVRWAHARHRRAFRRQLSRYWPFVRYMLLAFAAMGALYAAPHAKGFAQWVCGFLATIFGVGAFLNLWFGDAEATAAKVGEAWIARINGAPSSSTHVDIQDAPALSAAHHLPNT